MNSLQKTCSCQTSLTNTLSHSFKWHWFSQESQVVCVTI